jgi:hypothetical protein
VVLYPNPVGAGPVTLNPGLSSSSTVKVELFTVAFRKVNELTFSQVPAGGTVSIPLTDKKGTPLASGLYYVVVTTDQGRTILKLLVLR